MTPADAPKSTGEMMADIMGNVGNLVRNEVDLARAEITTSLGKAGGAVGAMAAALVALVIWAGLTPPWAAAAVGVAFIAVAVAVFLSARAALTQIGFMPSRTARNIQRDATAIKEAYNDK